MKLIYIFLVFSGCARSLIAGAPADLISELSHTRPQEIFQTRQSMPPELKEALRRTFKQRTLALANRNEPIRETSLVVDRSRKIPPTRRLIIGFETPDFFVVYYQVAGYQSGASVLAFKRLGTKAIFSWGGASFNYNSSATPGWLARQIRHGEFLDDHPFIW